MKDYKNNYQIVNWNGKNVFHKCRVLKKKNKSLKNKWRKINLILKKKFKIKKIKMINFKNLQKNNKN